MTPTRVQVECWIAWLQVSHDPHDVRDLAGAELLRYLRGLLDNADARSNNSKDPERCIVCKEIVAPGKPIASVREWKNHECPGDAK